MSIRVMIVEDEPIIRVGISQVIPWDELDCEVVALAVNGIEGIKKARETNPQLVISDIRMPQMDGLSMMEQLRPDYPEMEVILLTGYKEFEYARRAISYGINDYILKPVDLDELTEAVRKLTDVIHKREEQRVQWDLMRSKVQKSIPLLRDKFLHTLLFSGSETVYNVYEKMDYFDIKIDSFVIMCVGIDSFHDLEQKFTEEDIHILQFLIEDNMDNLNEKYSLNAYTFRHKKDIYAIFCEKEEKLSLKVILDYGKELVENVEKFGRFTISTGISQIYEGVEKLYQARKEADLCIDYGCELGNGSVISFCDIVENGNKKTEVPEINLNIYFEALKQSGDTSSQIDEICTQLSSLKNIALEKSICTEIISKSFRLLLEEYGEDEKLLYQYDIAMEQVYTAKNDASFVYVLRSNAAWYKEYISSQRNTRVRYLMNQAIDYMKQNCRKDVSLDEVADHLYISKWYFSKLFKRETGSKFTEYMSMLRIEEAQRIIRENPSLKNYEISDMLNFGNVRYFSQLFKKVTGKTPSEYRDRE